MDTAPAKEAAGVWAAELIQLDDITSA